MTADEFLLLYTVYIRHESPENQEVLKLATAYYGAFNYYDQKGHPFQIAWSTIVQKLVRDGYLISYPGHSRPGPDSQYHIDTGRLEVTDKFKKTILDDDREKWWDHFIAIFPATITINGLSISTLLPDKGSGQTYEDMKELFWKICGNGLMFKIGQVLVLTEEYFQLFDTPIKVCTYLNNFEGNMKALQVAKLKAEKTPGFHRSM